MHWSYCSLVLSHWHCHWALWSLQNWSFFVRMYLTPLVTCRYGSRRQMSAWVRCTKSHSRPWIWCFCWRILSLINTYLKVENLINIMNNRNTNSFIKYSPSLTCMWLHYFFSWQIFHQGVDNSMSVGTDELCQWTVPRHISLPEWLRDLRSDRFLSLARSNLRLCSANHRPGYWSNLPCDWPSTA